MRARRATKPAYRVVGRADRERAAVMVLEVMPEALSRMGSRPCALAAL